MPLWSGHVVFWTVLHLVPIEEEVLARASNLDPIGLRTLDAIHVATAASYASELSALITYDARMADAARLLELPVASPR